MSRKSSDRRSRKSFLATAQQCEALEIRQLMTASPVVAWQSTAPQPLLGETVQVGLTFTNSGDSAGFGPYVDVVVPRSQTPDQGLQYVPGSARFLDTVLSDKVVQFDVNGNAVHPFAVDGNGNALTLKGNPGDQLVVLQLPFGSYVANQPSSEISLQLAVGKRATVGKPLTVVATSGFRYGNDALDNPKSDVPVRGAAASLSVTPSLVQTRVTYLGPENETATGANFVQSYRVDVDVAAGASIDQLTLENLLDDSHAFLGIRNLSWDPKSINVLTTSVPGVATADSHLTMELGAFTGKAGVDGSYVLDFFIPQFDANKALIADPLLGSDGKSAFTVQAAGSWTVTPATTTTEAVTSTFSASATHILEDQNIAVQQSYKLITDSNVSGVGPGDILEYQINFQVSDYAWIQDLLLKTSIPNGQRLVSDSPVSFTVSGIKGYTDNLITRSSTGLSLLTQGKTTGQLDYQFDVSRELQSLGLDGILRGGATSGSSGQAVMGSIKYRTLILDSFEDVVPSGDLSVDEGDRFASQVSASGATVDPASQLVTTNRATDDSGASQQLAVGRLSTTVYAVNGQPATAGAPVKAGDLVTYRITRDVRSSDIENLSVSAFLPLPVYQVGSLLWQGSNTSNTAGTIRLGGNDTFHSQFGVTPQISVDQASNSFKLTYASVDSSLNKSSTLDLLVTVVVQDQPFADGMWLTSVARTEQGSSNSGNFAQTAITSVQYTRPVLSLLKAAISSDNPAAVFSGETNNTNISRIDAGDIVRFQILVENTGLSLGGAHDVLIKDAIPQGFVIPAAGLGMTVTDSSGKPIRYSLVNGSNPNSLLSGGIKLIDTLSGGQSTDGSNRLVVQYDLQVTSTVVSAAFSKSSAQLVVYAAKPGGNNYVTTTVTDEATETTATPVIQHTLITTDQASTTGNQVVIGETATFRAVVTIPEVTMNNTALEISLPRGMAIERILGVTVDGELKLASTNAASILASAKVLNASSADFDAGRILRLQVGDLVNANRDNSRPETIEVLYTATMTNDVKNLSGIGLRTSAVWSYNSRTVSQSSSEVKIVEPKLKVTTSWSSSTVDANDPVTVTLDVSHNSSNSANAYDVTLSDLFPSGTTYVPGSLQWVSGAVPTQLGDGTGSVLATWGSINQGTTSRLQYKVIVNKDVQAGMSLEKTSKVSWTSIPGVPGQIATSNTLAVERTGNVADVGGAANNYVVTSTSKIAVAPVKIAMTLTSTSLPETAGDNLTIGERATYQIVLTIPEGVNPVNLSVLQRIADSTLLPESLTLVSIGKSLTAPALTAGKTLNALDGKLVWDLGTITNVPDNKATSGDTLVFQLTGLLPNVGINASGDRPTVTAVAGYPLGSASATGTVTVVEPALQIVQKVSQTGVDAGAVVDATLQITHSGTSRTAFSLDLNSLASAGLTLVPGSVTTNFGTIVAGNGVNDQTFQVVLGQMADSQTIQIRYQVKVDSKAEVGSTLQLPATLSWKSLTGVEGRTYSSQVSTPLTINSNTLAGLVFLDTNQDGIQQQGVDRSLYQVEVQLRGVDHLGNAVQRTVSTDASGRYQFPGLRPGDYSLVETQPGNWSDGKDRVGTAGGTASNDRFDVSLPLGSNLTAGGYNFTESPLTWISGTVYVDADENAKLGQDEDGVVETTITLKGTTDQGLKVDRTTLTNDRGYYVFDNLEPGTYSVSEGETPGYFQASNQLGTRGGKVTGDAFDQINIKSGLPGEMYNFGEYRPGTISGQVYIDYDRDGVLDRKDGLIANVQVNLTGTDDLGKPVNATMSTDRKGGYSFGNLRPGNYSISTGEVADLDFAVANVGRVLGAYGPGSDDGQAAKLGFTGIRLHAGLENVGYNVGHTDPTYDPTILGTVFDSQTVIAGSNADDLFSVQVGLKDATVSVGGKIYQFDSSSTQSIRLLGSFGNDRLQVVGSEEKEEINLRKSSSTVTGTWFEIRSYGMEETSFTGGGHEDLARFYDTDGDDKFTAVPYAATMEGTGYKNQVNGVHRIYAYATNGRDAASLTGAVGQRDNFSVQPGDSRLYGDQFYLYASGFDAVTGNATDELDRAYMYGSTGDDQLQGGQFATTLKSGSDIFKANQFLYTRVQLDQGGTDRGVLDGSDGNDTFWSRPTETTFNVGKTQVIVQNAEQLEVRGGKGSDTATVYDTHYDDTFTAKPGLASMVNAVMNLSMTGFEKINTYANAGGVDRASVTGTTGADVFKASPTGWSLQGSSLSISGTGFSNVTAYGDSADSAFLTDSAFNDSLVLSSKLATMSGQQYSNSASGFGKVNAASSGGNDLVTFLDDETSSTIRIQDKSAMIFGAGFSHQMTGFSHFEAYFQHLAGKDSVELLGHVHYVQSPIVGETGKYKLSLGVNSSLPALDLKTTIDQLKVTL